MVVGPWEQQFPPAGPDIAGFPARGLEAVGPLHGIQSRFLQEVPDGIVTRGGRVLKGMR